MLRVIGLAAVLAVLSTAENNGHASETDEQASHKENWSSWVVTDSHASGGREDDCQHLEALRAAFNAMEKALNPDIGQCGVAGVKDGSSWRRPTAADDLAPKCGVAMATNCSLSYHQLVCPEDCPFMVPDQHFPCRFRCHPEDSCSMSNLNLPYADPDFKICSECSVVGCSWCKTPSVCGRCYPGFDLTEDGRCAFSITRGGWAEIVMMVLVVLVVLILLTGFFYCAFMPRSPHEMHNFVAIASGRRHRHLAKVHQWDLGSKHAPRRWHSLTVDLSKENVLGVGFGLYYNGICFVLVISLITLVALYINYEWSAVSFVLANPDALGLSAPSGIRSTQIAPAVITSPLESCHIRTPWVVAEILVDFAEKRVFLLGVLYAALFAISLWFIGHQKRWSDRFDAANTSMSDFCVLLSGLPCTATHEVELKKWAQSELNKKLPSSYSKIEVEGISICYDYRDKEGEVNGMLERFCSKTEIDLGIKLTDDEAQEDAAESEKLKKEMADDRKKALDWFEGADKLKGTGKAFLIFKASDSQDKVLQAVKQQPNLFVHPSTPSEPIEVTVVKSEPPDIFWQNIGFSETEISSNERKAVLKVLIIFLAINLIFIYPFNKYVVIPYLAAGSSAGGSITMINGIIMAIVNAQLGGQVWGAAFGVGYHRKDRADIFLFVMNTFITLSNTLTSLGLTALSVYVADKESLSAQSEFLGNIADDAMIGEESDMVKSMFLMLVPGQLFVNAVNGWLMGNVVPFVQHSFVQKVMYIWRCLPDFLLQVLKLILPWAPGIDRYERFNAEMAFMAGQIGLPWDYSNLIVNPFVVFITFFYVSPYCHRLCLYLFLWTVFYWFFGRFMHLRVQSVNYYSTNKLDRAVWAAWGLPLALLAMCIVAWAIRAGQFLSDGSNLAKYGALLGAFFLSVLLWVAAVLLVHPLRHVSVLDSNVGTFQDCKNRWIFSWFNCNPIFALKCLHHVKDVGGTRNPSWDHPLASGEIAEEVRYYRIGKECLHFTKEKQPLIEEGLHDSLEFETYLEILLGIANLFKRDRTALMKGMPDYTKVSTSDDPANTS